METNSFRQFAALAELCSRISQNPCDEALLKELQESIRTSPRSFVQAAQKVFISSFYPYIKRISKAKASVSGKHKELLVEALNGLLQKLSIEHTNVFFNFYTFILLELYNYEAHEVLPVTEEYKLALLQCMINLINCVSFDIVDQLYVKKNIPKFSQIIYVCSQLAKNKGARNIRSTAITCIMALARISNQNDLEDPVLRSKCADIFMFFLPGLSSTFSEISVENSKIGHALPTLAIRAFGRVITLVMQDYNPTDPELDLKDLLSDLKCLPQKKKLKSKSDIDNYLGATSRNKEWFKSADEKLNEALKKMGKLTYHEHVKVRNELVHMASNVVKVCQTTMSSSVCTLIENLIVLSQDSEHEVASRSQTVLREFSDKVLAGHLNLLDSLEDGLYTAIGSLPRKFNSIDDGEKAAAINLLIGYIHLCGRPNLSNVLLSPNMLHNLLQGLLHLSELERSHIRLFEEYTLKDLSSEGSAQPSFLSFAHFKDKAVQNRLDFLCKELAKNGCFELVYDSLVESYMYDVVRKKEALYLLNSLISGLQDTDFSDEMPIIKNLLKMYTDEPLNDLSEALDSSDQSVEQIQENVLIIYLITDGIGRISQVLKHKFQPILLKTLYLVLEKAGSSHPLIRTSGLLTIQTLTASCGYKDITDLLNSNFDFLSYHVQIRLTKSHDKNGALNVLSVVLEYCNVDALLPLKCIVDEVLLESCDRFKGQHATAYLRVFKLFVASLRRWFNVQVQPVVVKSRREKELEHEHFKVTEVENYSNDFSDEAVLGKSAEEMYKEDIEKMRKEQEQRSEVEEPGEYKKPSPPMHVAMSSQILKRSLHFLPSKDRSRKLLVLEILETGVEVLRDWDDELLPVVYQISLPLLQRFKEDKEPLVLQFSMRLLAALARLSKDFIRRTVIREVLPNLKVILEKASLCSYLKDKGSTYRYSQDYKLQREILTKIGPILYNVDADSAVISDMIRSIHVYLSDKQPRELQAASVNFIKMMANFDRETVKVEVDALLSTKEEYSANVDRLRPFLEEN